MDRRDFITTGLGLVTGALASSDTALGRALAAIEKAGEPVTDWAGVRKQFELSPERVHMTGLLLASNPKSVRDSIERHGKGLNQNPVEYFGAANGEEETVRRAAADFLGVTPDEIALTDSTTMGLALLYGGIRLDAGKEILATTHDHYATNESLDLRVKRTGARLRKITLYADSVRVTEEEVLTNLKQGLTAETRIFCSTYVHSNTGVKLLIRKMADLISEVNLKRDEKDKVLFCVDGVHGFGVENFTMKDLGCDFFVAGCHKWLFGPRGTGLLFGRKEVNAEVEPLIPTFSFNPAWGHRMTPGGFHSFEQRWSLAQAFAFHEKIGRQKIADRIHELNTQLKEGLAKIPGLKLYTPLSAALSAALTCFDVNGLTPKEVVAALSNKGIVASTTPYKVSYARLTPGILNTPDEITTALAAVAALAKG